MFYRLLFAFVVVMLFLLFFSAYQPISDSLFPYCTESILPPLLIGGIILWLPRAALNILKNKFNEMEKAIYWYKKR